MKKKKSEKSIHKKTTTKTSQKRNVKNSSKKSNIIDKKNNKEKSQKKEFKRSSIDFIKKYKLIIIGLFTAILIFMMVYSTVHYGPFEDLKKRIDNKETFVLVIGDENTVIDSYQKMLDYYKDVYDFKYTYINLNEWPPTTYNKLVKIIDLNTNTLGYPYLLYIDKGVATISSNNVRDENGVKTFLINANIIKKEYTEKDYLINDEEFKDFINDKNGNILFYARNDENIYKYRKELLKVNAKVSIIYAERLNNQEIEYKLRQMLKLSDTKDFNLPMLIKFRSGEIVDYKDKVGPSRLIDVYKELEKK